MSVVYGERYVESTVTNRRKKQLDSVSRQSLHTHTPSHIKLIKENKMRAFLLCLAAVAFQGASGFKFMSGWKLPSYHDMAAEVAVQERFGDKGELRFFVFSFVWRLCVCVCVKHFLASKPLTRSLFVSLSIYIYIELVVVTGTSSGLGRKTALALLRTGKYHVIGAVRDVDKMEAVAQVDGFDRDNFTPMQCELQSFASVRDFCQRVNEYRLSKPIDRLICNAGVYQPSLAEAKWSYDGHEQTMQINYLSHFLMIR